MARGRIISRSLGSSRKFSELLGIAGKLGEFAQALYPLVVVSADDFGRMAGDAFSVKFDVFPTCPRSETDFDTALTAMHHVGLVIRYQHEGVSYLQIKDFERHQAGLHKRTHSRFPEPSGKFPELPLEEKGTEEKGTEEKGTEEKGTEEKGTEEKGTEETEAPNGANGSKAPADRKPKRERFAPDAFDLTLDRRREAVGYGLTVVEVEGEFAKFCDHEFATPKSDWEAAWRNWVRRAKETKISTGRRV
jgi:hypothetical protein